MDHKWTVSFNVDEVVILQMSLNESIAGFNKSIKEIEESRAINLTADVKERLIASYQKRIDEHEALLKKIGV